MSKTLNNYLRVLIYLKEFEGDGIMHDIEDLLPSEVDKKTIFEEIAREGLIMLDGGESYVGAFMFSDSDEGFSGGSIYNRYTAKLTFKGSKYLKEELEMIDNNRYNIQIGDNATANLILNSPGASIQHNELANETIHKIIETLKSDSTLDASKKTQALRIFDELATQVNQGKVKESTWKDSINLGAGIASIGSLVLSLAQQFKIV